MAGSLKRCVAMSTPRRIVPGQTWFVTRRTTRRHYLLHPDADEQVQQLYWYTTAVIAAECGIELHAVQMLSTHVHEVLTDVRGLLPRFLQQRNRLFALAVKCLRKWPEEVFARAPANCVALYGPEAVVKEIAYTLANCVEAGLAETPEQWPGVTVSVDDIGQRVIKVARPASYFNPDNPRWPAVAEIRIATPQVLTKAYGERAKSVLRSVVDAAVKAARNAARAAGRVVQSVASLFGVPHERRATSPEAFGKRVPSFAAAGNRERAAEAALDRRTFLGAYREALERLKAGCRDVLFPRGTWRLRQDFGFAWAP